MRFDLVYWLSAVTFVSAAIYTLFLLAYFIAARRTVRPDSNHRLAEPRNSLPGVTILKPCAGADDRFEECLESFCALRYPRFEILCGVRDETDAALPILRRVQQRHPEIDFGILFTAQGKSANPKVAQLEILHGHGRYDRIWISDSNTLVHPDTLASMVRDLEKPGVGMVLSPVVGMGESSLGAALENLHIAAFITLSTLALFGLTHRVFGPGKSTLLRRESLKKIGGFEELGRYCAEDYLLVERLRANGERTVLGRHLVANLNVRGTVDRFYQRHLRWTQLHWLVEVGGAIVEPIIIPILPASLWFLAAPSRHSASALLSVLALQFIGDNAALIRLRGRSLSVRYMPLVLVRPFIFAALWVRASYTRKVTWRGNVRWLGRETLVLDEPAFRTRIRAIRATFRA